MKAYKNPVSNYFIYYMKYINCAERQMERDDMINKSTPHKHTLVAIKML
jgi:hypothetical protein